MRVVRQRFSSETELPEAERNSEPHGKKSQSDGERRRCETQKNPTDGCSVDGHGEGAGDHGTGFDGGVEFAAVLNGEAEGGKRDGGRGAEEAGKALRAEDVAEDREEADDCTADEEAKEQICHRRISPLVRAKMRQVRCSGLFLKLAP